MKAILQDLTYQGQLGLQLDLETLNSAPQFSNFTLVAGHLFDVAVNFCGEFLALKDSKREKMRTSGHDHKLSRSFAEKGSYLPSH